MNILSDIAAATAPELSGDALWYKDAVIYQIHVKSFFDSNNDGIGDFNGLTHQLDYIQDLGVTALWLLPFYPSPGRDDGYDIADYRRINPDFGSMKDFRRFMNEAKRRGLKVITELVINHTSDQHPWFKRARRSKRGSNARDWYVWSETDQKYLDTRIIFTDTEKSNWAWDQEAGAYFWHRFFSHQPDLNFDNPRVLWAMVQVMRRWLDFGVDGFRLDAIPYLVEREGTNNENLPETHAVIKKLRAELDAYAPGTFLLAEANQWPEDVRAYFGEGDECHMAFHFPLMPRIYMAIAQEDRFPINDILRQTPDIPETSQWALFLRNHDELTLEMVTDAERDYLWSTYAADPRARINLGIRRRLAPLMDNDRRKIELMNSLLLSLPGTPVVYYGDEIGMGDNIYLGDRNGVRTPMQWTSDRNGGFSRCDPAKLYLPPIMDPVYGYQAVNVEAQARSSSSLYNWMKRMIAVRKSSKVFGRGTMSILRPSNRSVLAYLRQYENEVILCVANLSRSAQWAEIDLAAWRGRVPIEMLGRVRFKRLDEAPFAVTLAPYGFFWFQLAEENGGASGETIMPREWITLVLQGSWRSIADPRVRHPLEREVLPAFLSGRRWFAGKGAAGGETRLSRLLPLGDGAFPPVLAVVDHAAPRGTARYALPLVVRWGHIDRTSDYPLASILAPVRLTNREGALVDAVADREVVSSVVDQIHAGGRRSAAGATLEFQPTAKFAESPLPPIALVRGAGVEQTNSTTLIDSSFVLKIYRRITAGVNPEVEMGRFLTDAADFANTPRLMGTIELVEDGVRSAVGVLHQFVENQGDAWSQTAHALDRYLEEVSMLPTDADGMPAPDVTVLNRVRQIGRRTAELHLALASRPDVADFAPEPVTMADVDTWTAELVRNAEAMFAELARRQPQLPATAQPSAQMLLARQGEALDTLGGLLAGPIDVDKIRHHGDFHLGQILIAKDDVQIVDFEGEPERPHAERTRKAPSARDAAGFVRSLDYAATSALIRHLEKAVDGPQRLTEVLDSWRDAATDAFLMCMRETTAGSRLWPSDQAAADRLLRFFIVEKAVYEVGYEFANRPDWVHVPLAGLARALFPVAGAQP
ncbi:maltose alpha-D-glucosyltransferase [Rhodoplanes sp. TEM]|uniref:maltose alpha-D-glucosyltransferase n=1 Tax=Rhodoplanes tepidamans TaxID=200616 RepID=A0ABT5JA62_RHOTP|nr:MULTISPECIES: maltose alpha-D-glucosyltransferase [Rhodoplanes]MDC7786570.1 maltose alpha-D-glucosyltransferase [Rhodoplanes tepidamans]MDC7983092.1 maltose alpha-D-glucosyltransferase [Rhodoplanes sp. TEM]MDQ0357549.1 maltose alpha-D-glucosyltransferase/alpha-amylase [Rhodoplanes tepidamans]